MIGFKNRTCLWLDNKRSLKAVISRKDLFFVQGFFRVPAHMWDVGRCLVQSVRLLRRIGTGTRNQKRNRKFRKCQRNPTRRARNWLFLQINYKISMGEGRNVNIVAQFSRHTQFSVSPSCIVRWGMSRKPNEIADQNTRPLRIPHALRLDIPLNPCGFRNGWIFSPLRIHTRYALELQHIFSKTKKPIN